jgi:hypothetical protein
MVAKDVTSLFYSRGGFTRTDSGSKMYVDPVDVKETYIPQALRLMNDLLGGTKVITVTFTGQDGTSGDLNDDSILAEFSCYYRDTIPRLRR